jgi:Ca2+-binding EF-hand superfamily protein
MLKHLNINAAPKLIDPLLEKIDSDKSGYIEYE